MRKETKDGTKSYETELLNGQSEHSSLRGLIGMGAAVDDYVNYKSSVVFHHSFVMSFT